MTVDPSVSELPGQQPLAELAMMLRDVTGESDECAAAITPASRLEADLRLESIEIAALGEMLREKYGDRADLGALYAELDIDQIIALTAGDLVAYVTGRGGPGGQAETGA
jgi:acyl carrier protein